MLILTFIHKAYLRLSRNILGPASLMLYNLYTSVQAHQRKKRSEYQLEQLDDYLLDDIGLHRIGDDIVPLSDLVCQNYDSGKQRKKRRLRHAYLFRRRRLNNSR